MVDITNKRYKASCKCGVNGPGITATSGCRTTFGTAQTKAVEWSVSLHLLHSPVLYGKSQPPPSQPQHVKNKKKHFFFIY